MKVYVLANLDQDWGGFVFSVHKSRRSAETSLTNLPDRSDRSYSEIIEMELEE